MENTSPDSRSQAESDKNSQSINRSFDRLRGLPAGLLLRCRDAIFELGISANTWKRWTDAGLPVHQKGTECAFVFTDDVIAFIRSDIVIPPVKPKPKPKKGKKA